MYLICSLANSGRLVFNLDLKGFKHQSSLLKLIIFHPQEMMFMFMISAQRQWRPSSGHTCLSAPLPSAGWSTTTVSMETTSPGSIQYPERWTVPTQRTPAIISWDAPTLVSSSWTDTFLIIYWTGNTDGYILINLLYLTAGHGAGHKVPKCSETKLDAITTDDAGKTYLFSGKVKKEKNNSTFWISKYNSHDLAES